MSGAVQESSSGNRLTINTAWLVIGRLVVAALGWGGTVLIARDLGQEAFGQFTLVFSLLGMLSIITDLGVGRVAVAALLTSDPDIDKAEFAGTYLILRTGLGLFGYLGALGIVVLLDYPSIVLAATAIAGTIVLFSTPAHAYDLAYQVRDHLRPVAMAEVAAQMAQVALTVALVLAGGGLLWYTVPAVLNSVVLFVWKIVGAHRLIDFRYRIVPSIWAALLKEAIPLTAGSAFVTLYYRMDSIMLSKLDTFEAVGRYGVAYKFVDLIHFLPTALAVAILAPLTSCWPRQPEKFGQILRNGYRLLAVAAGAALVGFWHFATPAVSLLYGSAYAEAGLATKIVVGAESVAFFSSLSITALIAASRHRVYPLITISGLIVNIIANLMLIPRFSIVGAASATLMTEILVMVLLASRVRMLGVRAIDPVVIRRLPVAIGGGLLLGWAYASWLPWLLAAALTGTTYFGFVFALQIVDRNSWRDLSGSPGPSSTAVL